MGKLWYFSLKFSAVLLCFLWTLHVSSASGFSMFSDLGSTFNLTSAGFAWVSTMEGPNYKQDGGEGKAETEGRNSVEATDSADQVEPAFTSIDSMLQWALGHSDPEKLKSTAQEVQRMTPQQIEQRQAELKELIDELRMKSDADLMKISLADLDNNLSSVSDRQRALQELLLLVEPIDNAFDLHKLGGLVAVIDELERDEGELRTTAAWVLGKAGQNNPVIQNLLLQLGALPRLMRMVESRDNEEAGKALFAVSALIRNFPNGQEAFYLDGGALMLQVLLSSETAHGNIQKKALVLLAELAEQQMELEERQDLSGLDDEVILISVVSLAEADDLDMQEKALMALRSLIDLNSTICETLQEVCHAEAALERLRLVYEVLMLDPLQVDYVKDLEVLRGEVAESILSQDGGLSSYDEDEYNLVL